MRLITFCLLVSFAILSFVANLVSAQTMSWEAENFKSKKGGTIEVLKPPFKTKNSDGVAYEISEASGNAFIGVPNGLGNDSGSWRKYEFNVPKAGDWYFWGRVVAPTVADNSFYWAFDITDADAVSADTNKTNIWDFYEKESLRVHYTTKWVWFRLNSRNGPFPGRELDQYGDNPTSLNLTAGRHVLYLIHREDGTYIDAIFATMSKSFDANKTPPIAVEPQGKLAVAWGELKQAR